MRDRRQEKRTGGAREKRPPKTPVPAAIEPKPFHELTVLVRNTPATVRLTCENMIYQGSTEAGGQVKWPVLPPGSYLLEVIPPEESPFATKTFTPREVEEVLAASEALEVALEPKEEPAVPDAPAVTEEEVCAAAGNALLQAYAAGLEEGFEEGLANAPVVVIGPGTEARTVKPRVNIFVFGEDQVPIGGVLCRLFRDGVQTACGPTNDQGEATFEVISGDYDLVVPRRLSVKTRKGQAQTLYCQPNRFSFTTERGGAPMNLSVSYKTQATERAYGTIIGQVYATDLQGGLEGVSLELVDANGQVVAKPVTNANGEIRVDVAPGIYTLRLPEGKVASTGGQRWEPAPDTPARHTLLVQAGQIAPAELFELVREEHILDVDVVDPDGRPLPFAQVYVQDESGRPLRREGFAADARGHVTIHLERAGEYRVSLDVDAFGNPRQAPQVVPVHSRQTVTVQSQRPFVSAASLHRTMPAQAVIDVPYPLLTETSIAPSAGPTGATAAGTDPGRIVQNTLNEVLGWKSRPYKAEGRGFIAALNQAFTLKEVEGHTEFSWIPRSYAVAQDMGALTGAQASIYTRAKVALDQVLPLLDGLYPLRSEADDQEVEAIRAIVRSNFTELVSELGVEGGPRVPRVDALFIALFGRGSVDNDPEKVKGLLGELAKHFGLERSRVNTIEEEQNLTNFLIVVDYVIALQKSWEVQKPSFSRTDQGKPFFGTQMVLLSRALAVISESVQEVYHAMDSVFLGPAERQVVELIFKQGTSQEPLSMFVAELLSWVDDAASEEGPRLIQEGGKRGVAAFQPTLDRLAQLVNDALLPTQDGTRLPAGYSSARVQRALQELAEHLKQAAELASRLGSPAPAQYGTEMNLGGAARTIRG